MTPTEQDKELDLSHLKDVRAVLKWCYDHGLLKGEFPTSNSLDKAYLLEQGEKRLTQLITADRKRVASSIIKQVDKLLERGKVHPVEWERLASDIKAQQEEV